MLGILAVALASVAAVLLPVADEQAFAAGEEQCTFELMLSNRVSTDVDPDPIEVPAGTQYRMWAHIGGTTALNFYVESVDADAPSGHLERENHSFSFPNGQSGAFKEEVKGTGTWRGVPSGVTRLFVRLDPTWKSRANLDTTWIRVRLELKGPSGACDGDPSRESERNGDVGSNGKAGDPVTTATGNFVYAPESSRVWGSQNLLPTYNSRDRWFHAEQFGPTGSSGSLVGGSFGAGWTSFVDTRLRLMPMPGGAQPQLMFRTPTGRIFQLPSSGVDAWTPPTDLNATALTRSTAGTFTLMYASGEEWKFDSAGRLISTETAQKQRIEIARTGGMPTSVVASSQGQAVHAWNLVDSGRPGLIDQIVGPYAPPVSATPPADTTVVQATYDLARDQLTDLSAPFRLSEAPLRGEHYIYETGSSRISSVTRARSALPLDDVVVVQNVYDAAHRVKRQTNELGEVDDFAYNKQPSGMITTVDHRNDAVVERLVFQHDTKGRLVGVVDPYPAPNQSQQSWDRDQLGSAVTRRGGTFDPTYDAAGRPTTVALPDPVNPGATLGTTVTTYCGPNDDRPVDVTDAAGIKTRYWWTTSTTSPTPCDTSTVPKRVTHAYDTTKAWTTTIESTPDGLVTLSTDDAGGDDVATRFNWGPRRLLASKVDYPDGTAAPGRITYYGYSTAGWPLVTREVTGTNSQGVPVGVETWTLRDAAGRVVKQVGPVEVARACQPTICDFPTQPASPVTLWNFKLDGSLASRVDPETPSTPNASDRTTTYVTTYPAGGGRVEQVSPPGHGNSPTAPGSMTASVTTSTFDRFGRLTSVEVGSTSAGEAVSRTESVYDPLGRLKTLTRKMGGTGDLVQSFDYDNDGNQTVVAYGGNAGEPTRRLAERRYDLRGRLVEERGPTGDTSAPASVSGVAPSEVRTHRTWTYDQADRLLEETSGDGASLQRVLYRYDVAGRLQFQIVDRDGDGGAGPQPTDLPVDADDHVTEYTYTSGGRLQKVLEPPVDATSFDWPSGTGKRVTEFRYDKAGQVTQVIDALNKVTTQTYTLRGELKRRTLQGGAFRENAYDAAGRIRKVTSPSPTGTGTVDTTTTYDDLGRKVAQTDQHPSGTESTAPTTRWSYWNDGLLKTAVNPLGGVDSTVTYYYDSRGNRRYRTSMTQGSSDPSTKHLVTEEWTYDLADRMVSSRRPGDTVATTYEYHGTTGWLKKRVQPSGRVQTWDYWNSGQVKSITSKLNATAGPTDTFRACTWFDSVGNETHQLDDAVANPTACTGGEVTARTFDRTGRISSVLSPDTPTTPAGQDETLTYTWDLEGRPRTVTYADGTKHQFLHDKLGRLATAAIVWAGGGGFPIVGYSYDDNGNVTNEQINWSEGSRSWTYPANDAATPISYTQQIPGGNRTTAMAYRPDGRLSTEQTGASVRTYDYDAAGQLTRRQDTAGSDDTYTYGPRGLRLASVTNGSPASFSYDDKAQLVSATFGSTPRTFAYDADGRRTMWQNSIGAQTTTYDERGLPSKVRTTITGSADTIEQGLGYDANRQLVTQSLKVGSDAPTQWSFQWDPTRPAAVPMEVRFQGALWARSNYGLEFVGVHLSSSGSASYYAFDLRRSVVPSTSNSGAPGDYDAFGLAQGAQMFQYGYRSEVSNLGQVHLRNRDYHPQLGMFATPDPLDGTSGTAAETNPYAYALNDPVNRTDRLGLSPDECRSQARSLWRLGEWACEHLDVLQPMSDAAKGFIPGYDCYNVVVNHADGVLDYAGCAADVLPLGGAAVNGAIDAGKHLDEGADIAKLGDDVIDAEKGTANAPGLGGIDDAGKTLDEAGGVAARGGGEAAPNSPRPAEPVRPQCSFSADTGVVMADGTVKRIAEVDVGDVVLATDPETGESGAREVTATLPHMDQLVALATSAGDITTTEDHRYWNQTDGEWQQAQDLDRGDRLRSDDGGAVMVIGLDWSTTRHDDAYDLTVADLHTFYVAAGDSAALVHNDDCGILPLRGSAATDAAAKLGYTNRIPAQKVPFNSHGQPAFSNGKRFITPDVDVHNGGVWKMFNKKGSRLGTYDANLKRIGD